MTLAHTQSKGREYETFQPTREKRRSASCRLRVVGRGQATPMIVIYICKMKYNMEFRETASGKFENEHGLIVSLFDIHFS